MSELQKILLVEDDADIRQVAQMALEVIGGLEVAPCDSGASAVERAAEFAPDLILLDVMMPGMDGPTTLRGLRALEATAETPVVFMTAKVQAADRERYLALGAVDMIGKPFDPMALAALVREIWAGVETGR